jgi:hypothetical protein
MGRILLEHDPAPNTSGTSRFRPLPAECDPTATARGILRALAISALFWIALALAVPRLW